MDRSWLTNVTTRASPWRLAEGKDEGSMWLAWLVRLRWVAIIGQVVTLLFSLGVLEQPWIVGPILFAAVGLLALANVVAVRTLNHHDTVPPATLVGHLFVDIAVLTGFFLAAGGAANPFVTIYLIHVSIAAVMMPPRWAIALMVTVVLANLSLHRLSLPLHPERHPLPADSLLSLGQIIAMTVTVFSIGTFVMGMSATLRRHKQRLLEARDRTAQTDRLRAVGTLAAGAAHEINTPLSTMGLRLRRIQRRHDDEATQADVEVIRSQLDRCKEIVEQLLIGAGDPSASGFARAPLQQFVDDAVRLWSKGSPIDVRVRLDPTPVLVELPNVAFTQALINLLENAREAQQEVADTTPLLVEVTRDAHHGVVRIFDHGSGLPDNADRIGEPFYTTKPTGTGLGVFVARALAHGAGGGLSYDRVDGQTITEWTFPEVGSPA